jgi:hypothetical protein
VAEAKSQAQNVALQAMAWRVFLILILFYQYFNINHSKKEIAPNSPFGRACTGATESSTVASRFDQGWHGEP